MPKPRGGGAPVRSFRDLRVWQAALQLAIAVEALVAPVERGPRWELASQLHRAATSVHANIAEGFGRRTPRDRARFYTIAWSSLLEVEALLTELAMVRPASEPEARACSTSARHVGRLLMSFRRCAH